MTREKIDTLLKLLDKLGSGDAVRKLQSTRDDAPPFASVTPVSLGLVNTESSLAPWNESKTSSGTYLAALRALITWKAVRVLRSCLDSWMRFKPLSLITK